MVTLGGDSGSFVFAHADRFIVPRTCQQEGRVKTDDASTVGVVYGHLDNPERNHLLENGFDSVDIPDMRELLLKVPPMRTCTHPTSWRC